MKSPIQQKIFSLVFILTAVLSGPSPVFGQSNQTPLRQVDGEEIIQDGFGYLLTQLNQDGGIRWTDEGSSIAATKKVVLALAASHYPQDYLKSSDGHTPIDFLKDQGSAWVYQRDTDEPGFNTARAGQLLTVIAAANENPHAFGQESTDFLQEINAHFNPGTGIYGQATQENVTDQVWSMLGLSANHMPVPIEAVDWLEKAQFEDGRWNDGFEGYLDMTPLAIMALLASGHRAEDSPEIQSAMVFLQEQQNAKGGWQTQWDMDTNANTTGIILQAIATAGENPSDDKWQKETGNPLAALAALQGETGVIGGEYANAYSTADAILGLSGQPLYFLGEVTRANHAFDFIVNNQLSDGSWGNIGQTIDVVLAVRAAGWDPNSFSLEKRSPLDAIAENMESYIEIGPDTIGKLILALVASGTNPENFAGVDLPEMLMGTYDKAFQAFGDPENSWHQSLAILGLVAAGVEIPEAVIDTLISLQADNGGWEYSIGTGTWPDSTALAIQALIAGGLPVENPVIQQGLNYVADLQTNSGGWGDSSTTAYVLMALNAIDSSSPQWQTNAGRNPVLDLLSYQKLNGAFVYSWDTPDDNLMATAAAMLALFGGSYLLEPNSDKSIDFAGLIVDPNNQGERIVQCLPVGETALSGMTFLESSNLKVETEQGFINAIGGIANPKGDTLYWSYWHWDGRQWQFYETGAGQTTVLRGDIQAWYLTSWEEFPSKPPTFQPSLREICATNVLKNYATQPYLNHLDLQGTSLKFSAQAAENSEETADVLMKTPTKVPPQSEPTKTFTQQVPSTPVKTKEFQWLPLLAIGILGLGTIIAIFVIVNRKNT